MALVTVQRSPSVAGSPQCSNSDGEADEDEGSKHEKSECFFAGKDTALVLALKDIPQYAERRLSTDSTRSTNSTQSNNSDIQQHLQSMFNLLQNEETLKMAVKLESQRPNRTRYLVIVSSCCYRTPTSERRSKIIRHNSAKGASTTSAALLNNPSVTSAAIAASVSFGNVAANSTQRQLSVDSHKTQQSQNAAAAAAAAAIVEEAIAASRLSSTSASPNLCSNRNQSVKCDVDKETAAGDNKNAVGIEESCLLGIDCNERTTIGLVVPILADTTIHLDGDGGFSVSVYGKTHIFKPVSVQAMWSALQTLHKVSQKARENNFYPGGPSHDWLSYYESRIASEQSCLNEWNAMDSLESRRPPSPDAIRNKPTAKEETESVIKMKLKEIMMSVDLDEVTSKYIRGRLEEILDMDLGEYKSFIDAEMLIILGQMDAPTEIFEHVYLGSEWNASNLEELQKNGVRHILNVTREIDNFFPGMFDYFNVRVYDDEKTNLLKHWDNTYRYITRAKAEGSKVLVHCKMGVSRSASVVIAYAMKAYNWEFQRALQHVKERRSCIKPNKNFLNQLETYSGMLDAMKNKEKLQRSKSETNLKCTKDARLLPGSEPTPLIQALNQAKSKSAGETVVAVGDSIGNEEIISETENTRTTPRRSSTQKQRRIGRRSSSTSPKTQTVIVRKQQSQSMENLTPERSVAEEPKNVRFPGSNGENYSVTQNQVLHIQKHTPTTKSVRTRVHDLEAFKKPPHVAGYGLGSPVWTSSSKLITQTSNLGASTSHRGSSSSDVFSTQVDNVFAKEEQDKRQRRKTQSWTETSGPSGGIILDAVTVLGTSITANTNILRTRVPRQRELPSRHASWGSGDNRCSLPLRNSSSSFYDSNRNATTATSAIFEGQIHDMKSTSTMTSLINNPNKTANTNISGVIVGSGVGPTHAGTVKRTKQKLEETTGQKKLCQENGTDADVSCNETNKRNSNLYRSASAVATSRSRHPLRCNSEELVHNVCHVPAARRSDGSRPLASELYSASAPVSYTSSDIENKNTGIEIEASVVMRNTNAGLTTAMTEEQRVSGNVQILKQSFEAKAAVGQNISTVAGSTTITTTTTVTMTSSTGVSSATSTSTSTPATLATTTQSAKKSHQSLPSSPVAQHVDHVQSSGNQQHGRINIAILGTNTAGMMATATVMNTAGNVAALSTSASSTCSSTSTASGSSSSSSASSSSSSTASSVSENCDRNVKGLVHKYQTTNTSSSTSTTSTTSTNSSSSSSSSSTNTQTTVMPTVVVANATVPKQSSTTTTTLPMLSNTIASGGGNSTGSGCMTNASNSANVATTFNSYKTRPRSHYDRTILMKTHDYSDSRPPPAPARAQQQQQQNKQLINSSNMHTTDCNLTQHHHQHQQHHHHHHHQPHHQQQQQQQQQRRLAQHGKTHPLTMLSLPKQSFNAAAYNTM